MRKRCINKNDFSDITFLIGPKREPIHAHRAMLAARSEVFRTVLKQQLVNGNNKQGRDNAGFDFWIGLVQNLDSRFEQLWTITASLWNSPWMTWNLNLSESKGSFGSWRRKTRSFFNYAWLYVHQLLHVNDRFMSRCFIECNWIWFGRFTKDCL